MFEKSLYDLIRGMRENKGNERGFIQDSIKECRKEIKSQNMDMKATAVLKLIYLEMFGYDMSWASFNVLEVMSSPKHAVKRIGYLGAIQSYRPDTEILLLAENLLKKDINSPVVSTISLPILAIPHVINPAMANSLLSDLLKRLSHSEALVRKKTVVALYRLALVYPDTLRPAWPRIKEKLSDEDEDPSVTAAVINVVCELGWRRPQDFLPLAPRLFDLLVDARNNWMSIKLIKLFASLTPLEPRLIKKLLPPLTSLMKETEAMSLLYECINGIIDGGILENAAGTTEGDDIARLCIVNLRRMLLTKNDPNLIYVALLAFKKIVELHPYLVSMQEDVILECVEDADVSIRLQALDLVVGMVNAQNLTTVVDKLMSQLQNSVIENPQDALEHDRGAQNAIDAEAYSDDDEDLEQEIGESGRDNDDSQPLPDSYRSTVIERILEMCSQETYSYISDFEWYIDVLLKLVKHVPATSPSTGQSEYSKGVAYEIGRELQNVAVRVKSSREEAVRAAEALIAIDKRSQHFPPAGNGAIPLLEPVVWIVGEFASCLLDREGTLSSLLHSSTVKLSSPILMAYIQAIFKVFSSIAGNPHRAWTREIKTATLLTIARVVNFLEPLATHPDVEVQERAVEFLELGRLATEAATAQESESSEGSLVNPPLILTQVIPSLFSDIELNPVSRDAQRKVPVPDDLNLDEPINENLAQLLHLPEMTFENNFDQQFQEFYYQKPAKAKTFSEPAANRLGAADVEVSYQQEESKPIDAQAEANKRAARRARNKDDPFYIASDQDSDPQDKIHKILHSNIGDELDVDAIPIMRLDLTSNEQGLTESTKKADSRAAAQTKTKKTPKKLEILGDENLDELNPSGSRSSKSSTPRFGPTVAGRGKKSLLQVDSSGLSGLSLDGGRATQLDIERREAEEAEMAQAIKEVERMRLEMQRASESILPQNGSTTEAVVKRKKKQKKKAELESGDGDDVINDMARNEAIDEATAKKKKKKKKKEKSEFEGKNGDGKEEDATAAGPGAADEGAPEPAVQRRKKKKKQVVSFNEE